MTAEGVSDTYLAKILRQASRFVQHETRCTTGAQYILSFRHTDGNPEAEPMLSWGLFNYMEMVLGV